MKKVITTALAIVAMVACSEDETTQTNPPITEADIKGSWVMDKIDNLAIPTNEVFACSFEDGLQDYFQWAEIDEDNSTVIFKDDVPYTIEGSILTFDSVLDYIVLDVTLEGDQISWLEIEKIIDGVDYYAGLSYQGYRVETDYYSLITQGVWEGCATEGRTENPYLRIAYYADNTFDFQYRASEEDEWSDKVDNDGQYYIIGDLLNSVWTNDINSGIEGSSSESWIISIEEDTMVWIATREEDHFESFEFVRVE